MPRRWWSMDRSSQEPCAGRTWLNGSGLPMAKTTRTRYPVAGACSRWTAVNHTLINEDRVASPVTCLYQPALQIATLRREMESL
jgi:hypothetical protein